MVVQRWAPLLLRWMLDTYFFQGGPHTPTATVWSAMAAYHYLRRLRGRDTLAATVAVATQAGDTPAAAREDATFPPTAGAATPGVAPVVGDGGVTSFTPSDSSSPPAQVGPAVTPTAPKTHFFGTVTLDPIKAKGEFARVVDEMVQLFTERYGTEVNVTVKIQARHPDGSSESVQRAARDNSQHLGFD